MRITNEAIRIYKPDGSESFYCHNCDGNIVYGDRPETGTFFYATGHVLGYGEITDDYESVVFAICPECLDYLTELIGRARRRYK